MKIIVILIIVIVTIIVFFNISYSKTKNEFAVLSEKFIAKAGDNEEMFEMKDIENLPRPVQKYFINCGYIGTKKMNYMKINFKDVDFSLGKDKPTIKIDYTQYNLVEEPERIAYIDSSMYGVPFEGLDSYIDGKGSMKGVLAKVINLFDQRGKTMDSACLVTYLAECLIIPNAALQDFIHWEEIDENHVKATISYYGISVGGIFEFNELGEMISFTTDDRVATSMDGKEEKARWTALCSDYKEINGIKKPSTLQAVWHYEEGDLLYFDGKNFVIE